MLVIHLLGVLMANFKDNAIEQGRFISIIPAEQILPGSFDETLQLLVDQVLDLNEFESDYKNDKGGATAYPPSSLLKIILAAYHRGITSSRKIETLCRFNTAFMALSGFLMPDHSTIAAFVSKSSVRIEKLFIEIVLECDHLGLIGGDTFALDGTKLSSNASKEWSGTVDDFERKYQKVKRAIRYMIKCHREEDVTEVKDKDLREKEEKQLKKLRKLAKKFKQATKEVEDKIGAKGRPKKSNLTDNDSASMMSGAGGAIQGYMALAVVDKDHQVIAAADVSGDSEQGAFVPMVEQLMDNLGESQHKIKVLADAGFHSQDNIEHCFEHQIDGYIADNKMRKRDPRFIEQEGKKPESRKRKYFRAEDFLYREDENRCFCPAGKELWLAVDDYLLNDEHYRRFVGYLEDCRNCPLQTQCMRNPPGKMGRQVSIKQGKEFNPPRPIDLMKEKIDSRKGRSTYSDRMGIVEPVFGHIKHTLGLRWLSLRGKLKVKGQWLLFCMVHNRVKIQNYGEYESV